MRRRSIDQQLRIHLHYDDSIAALPHEQQQLIKDDLIARTVPYWERTLSVRRTEARILLQRHCVNSTMRYRPDGDPHPYCTQGCRAVTMCGETPVPPHHLDVCRQSLEGAGYEQLGVAGEGVSDSDLILYISAHETDRCSFGSTVAYSAYCQQETAFDRPVAGYVNLCPSDISTKLHDLSQMYSTMRHEVLHALGFSVGLFAFFRDDDGQPLTERNAMNLPPFNQQLEVFQWSDRIIRTIRRSDWLVRGGNITREINVVVTPRVLEEVRRHFDCPSLEGAELEDQDPFGTALSHWEKRIFENEAMTGGFTQNSIISRMTLALMEDTGWYRADYAMAEPLQWGAGLGCQFAQKSCREWMLRQTERGASIHPYCARVKRSDSLHTDCTDDYSAVAVCNLGEYPEPLPPQYQYFDSLEGVDEAEVTRYAGSVLLADFCPFIQEFNWKNARGETVRTSSCTIDSHIPHANNYNLEQYGGNSRCFQHKASWEIRHCDVTHVVDNWGSGCYQRRCDAERGLLVVVNGIEYQCVGEGHVIRLALSTSEWHHTGAIICPSCHAYCKTELPDGCPQQPKIMSIVESQKQDIPCKFNGGDSTLHSGPMLAIVINIITVKVFSL